jgi:hypothetical protein
MADKSSGPRAKEAKMKECPLCKETFADDLKFCDLDGTRLKRVTDASGASGPGKVWSLLGVGLLLGAIIISAASIIFLPKAQVSPPVTGTQPSAASAPAQAKTAEPVATTNPQSTPDTADLDLKKKDRPQSLGNKNNQIPVLNPKTAALAEDEASKATAKTGTQEIAPAPRKDALQAEPPLPKPIGSTRKPESVSQEQTLRPAQTNTEMKDVKRDQKRSAPKTTEKEKEEKRSSFFKVFKKIFGKD